MTEEGIRGPGEMAGLPDQRASKGQNYPSQLARATLTLLLGSLVTLICTVEEGLGEPVGRTQVLQRVFGNPCDCGGGNGVKPTRYTQTTDCGGKTAYLEYKEQLGGGFEQHWKCINKPIIIPAANGRPGPCPQGCTVVTEMHSSCYREVQQCTHTDGKTYLTAILQKQYSGSFGGDWDLSHGTGYSKYAQASCKGTLGKPVCWPPMAPIHISDGGGPTDRVRENLVQTQIEKIIKRKYPPLNYHPLALQKLDLNVQTHRILDATLKALNVSNPKLAEDCWLCMALGTPMPLAIPPLNTSVAEEGKCAISLPFRVQPIGFNTSTCFQRPSLNDSSDLDVGFMTFANCSHVVNVVNHSRPLCPAPGQTFVCGGSLAFTALPNNWTGLCVQAVILPDLDIIPGDEPVPLPSVEFIAGRSKRAVQLVPLLIGLGVTGAVASGTTGLGVAGHTSKLSNQLVDDVQTLSGTIDDPQDQIDCLAEVVLQNRKGLDLQTAEQGGTCLALQERCCFYANKSGIVRDKIKTLQEDLNKRRKELLDNPLWSGLNGFLPYILPLLGLLLLLAVGPCLFKSLVNMIQAKTQDPNIMVLRTHYHNPATEDGKEEDESRI